MFSLRNEKMSHGVPILICGKTWCKSDILFKRHAVGSDLFMQGVYKVHLLIILPRGSGSNQRKNECNFCRFPNILSIKTHF